MKNYFLMPLLISVAALASCDKTDYNEKYSAVPDSEAVLNVNVNDSYFTKASGVSSETEKTINNVQTFVFRDDGTLDAYQNSQTTAFQIKTTTGAKRIYVFANAPSLSEVSSENELLAKPTLLSDNTIGRFVMSSGAKTFTLDPGENNLQIVVNRIASKVEISKITNAMTSAQYQNKTFKVLAAYLTNVAADTNYGLTGTPSNYYNMMGYHSSAVDNLIYDNYSGGQEIEWNNSLAAPHYLYAYPNPSADTETTAGTWSARSTRLVIKASFDGTVYYYPIILPAPFLGNRLYKIDEIKITRPGSLDEDIPVSFADCGFSISVSDWSVTNLGNIEI